MPAKSSWSEFYDRTHVRMLCLVSDGTVAGRAHPAL
jgi:hypothetical protein